MQNNLGEGLLSNKKFPLEHQEQTSVLKNEEQTINCLQGFFLPTRIEKTFKNSQIFQFTIYFHHVHNEF